MNEQQPATVATAENKPGCASVNGSAAGTDWKGNQITEQEPPEKMIKVWQIEPHPTDSAYDGCLCRSYQHAVEAMKLAIENTVDAAEEETLTNEGIKVKVKVVEMRKCDYEAEIADD